MQFFKNYIAIIKNSPLKFKGEVNRRDYFKYLIITPFLILIIGACEISFKALLMDMDFNSALEVIHDNRVKIVYSSNYLFLLFSWSLIPMSIKRIRNTGFNSWLILIPLLNIYLIFKKGKI